MWLGRPLHLAVDALAVAFAAVLPSASPKVILLVWAAACVWYSGRTARARVTGPVHQCRASPTRDRHLTAATAPGTVLSMSGGPGPASQLPVEVIGEILSFAASGAECCAFGLVSSYWHDAMREPVLWQRGAVLREFHWPIGDRLHSILHGDHVGGGEVYFSNRNPLPPHQLDHVTIDANDIESLPADFLAGRGTLVSLHVVNMSKLKRIPAGFLRNCAALTTVIIEGLSSVTEIGDDFLKNCPSLTSVIFRSLTSLTSIGEDFLKDSPALASVDLSGLSSLTAIPQMFLTYCPSLRFVRLSNLRLVKSIPFNFVLSCPSLETLELHGLRSVVSIAFFDRFVHPSLTTVCLSGLCSLKAIGDDFMKHCPALTTVKLSGLNSLLGLFTAAVLCPHYPIRNRTNWMQTETSMGFLKGRHALVYVELNGLSSLKTVGDDFLRNCPNLKTARFSGVRRGLTTDENLLADCPSLAHVVVNGENHTKESLMRRD